MLRGQIEVVAAQHVFDLDHQVVKRSADFVAALDSVNASADAAPGFVWRLQTEDGNATAIRAFEWDAAGSAGVIVNLSVWRTIEDLEEVLAERLAILRAQRRRSA